MAVTHPVGQRNGLADFIVDQLNNGFVEFQTAGSVEVATCGFGATAFGAAASGVATANTLTPDASATGGTTSKAELQTSGSAAVVLCSVTAIGGGGDIEITSVAVAATEEVDVTSLTYTAPL